MTPATQTRAPGTDPLVRSHARGRRFWTVLLAPWPLAVLIGAAVSAVLGVGLAVTVGAGLAIALGIDFVWVVVVLAVDDGDIDDEVRRSVGRAADRPAPGPPRGS